VAKERKDIEDKQLENKKIPETKRVHAPNIIIS
jgi:hypothetical protein